MTNLHALFDARDAGEIRYALIQDFSSDMSTVLGKFGLIPDKSLLVEKNQEETLAILTELLWKDLAYREECMPQKLAESLAQQLIIEHENRDSRYFSNVLSLTNRDAYPLTKSAFDAGIIIASEITKKYFCIWFEDED